MLKGIATRPRHLSPDGESCAPNFGPSVQLRRHDSMTPQRRRNATSAELALPLVTVSALLRYASDARGRLRSAHLRCTSHSSGSRQSAVDPNMSCAHAKKRGLSMLCIPNVKRVAKRESSGFRRLHDATIALRWRISGNEFQSSGGSTDHPCCNCLVRCWGHRSPVRVAC